MTLPGKQVWFVCTLALLVVLAIFSVIRSTVSQAATVDWSSPALSVTKVSDLETLPAYSNYDCTRVNIQVKRGLSLNSESHCTVPTAMGAMEIEGKIVQAPGYSEAYAVSSGNSTVLPIPTQPAALSMRGSSIGVGVNYELYKQFYNHTTFNQVTTDPKFTVTKPADNIFKYGDGQAMQFNPYTLSFPGNGRYMLVDTIFNGFMVMDMRTLTMKPFAESLVRANNTELLRASVTMDNGGRYAAIAYGTPGSWGSPYFKMVDTGSCNGGFNNNSRVVPAYSCTTIDLRSRLEQQIPGLQTVRNVRFANDRTVTFSASYGTAPNIKFGKFAMVAGGQALSLTQYLALGDSYISGEGAYSYRSETDTERNRCHQSSLSYPYLLRPTQGYASVACSGAKLHNIKEPVAIGSNLYQVFGGQPSVSEEQAAAQGYIPGILFQKEFVDNDNPEAITVSIGGNDIGFGQVLERCVHPLKNVGENIGSQHTCYPTYEDRLELVNLINRQLPKLRQLYTDLRSGGVHDRRVYVIGYPQVAKVGGDCGLNVQMNAAEIQFASDLVAYLDSVIAQAAREAGVYYVDTQQAFDGKRLCEGDGSQSAMNGFTVGKQTWGGYGFAESFHPNKTGHRMLADTIAVQTDDLTKPMPPSAAVAPFQPVDPNLPILKNAPFGGRAVRHVQLIETGQPVVEQGASLDVVLNAQTYSTKPDSVYEASLHSNPISLGSYRSDAAGNVTVAAVIPAGVEPGFHTLHIQGSDVFGKLIDLQRTLYIAASADDYDGDGIANATDSCAYAQQSGIDRDTDAVDDACDAVIGLAPIVPEMPDGIIWRDDAVLSLEIQSAPVSGQ